MDFCEKCGKPMHVVNDGLNKLVCSCGFSKLVIEGKNISFDEKQPIREKRGEGAVEKKHDLNGFPHICKKCGFGEAEAIELGVFYGDEAGVYLFKCKKCGYSERQSDGTGN
jgi:DNA-directed RNA polymerase subunit M/transcription elongation factor TFIIS